MPRQLHKPDKKFGETIKTIPEIDQAFKELLSADFTGLSIESIKQLYYKNLSHLSIPIQPVEKDLWKHLPVYRARVIDANKEDITKVSTFGPPKPEQCTNMGRANWPEKPVLYCADKPYTALAELKALELGNEFYIAKWGFDLANLQQTHVPLSTLLFGNMSEHNPWQVLMGGSRSPFQEIIDDFGQEKGDAMDHLNKQICNAFVSPEYKHYPLTAFIANNYVYSEPSEIFPNTHVVLMYPSIMTGNRNCNFAIHPQFVEQYMKATRFIHVKVAGNSINDLTVSVEKVGVSSDNENVEWYSMLSDEAKSSYKINLIGCPTCGRIYYPEEFSQLEFTREDKPVTLNQLVEMIMVPDKKSPFNNLPPEVMHSMKFPFSVPAIASVDTGQVTNFKCGNDSHKNPYISVNTNTAFKYERLNMFHENW